MFKVGDEVVFNQDFAVYANSQTFYANKGQKGVVKSVGTHRGRDTLNSVKLSENGKLVTACAFRLSLVNPQSDQELADRYRELHEEARLIHMELEKRGYKTAMRLTPHSAFIARIARPDPYDFKFTKTVTITEEL